jgi:hypothetical protein
MEIKIQIGDGATMMLIVWAVAFAIVGFMWAVTNYHPLG